MWRYKVFNRLLVTLDGSELSERALEPAFAIAQKFKAEITLLRVITVDVMIAVGASGAHTDELRNWHVGHEREAALAYLGTISARWQGMGVPVRTRVMTGAPPERILSAVAENGIDLIVMSTHGWTGLSRLLYGSVAEAVVRGTHLPVLLIPLL